MGWPSQSTVAVLGSRVVSERNGLPSTLPSSTTDLRVPIGNSGLVMLVGCVNLGRWRSTRSLSGAQPLPLEVPQGVGGSSGGLSARVVATATAAVMATTAMAAATERPVRCSRTAA